MDEKNLHISIIPQSIERIANNITDKPSKSMGQTFDDIWYLVLGGHIGYRAEKRKMKYAKALEEYRQNIEDEINKIPDKNKMESDIQIVGPALEKSKYCADKIELRKMFAKLIASSMDSRKENIVHPIFTDIISRMTNEDALVFGCIAMKSSVKEGMEKEAMLMSLMTLKLLGLVNIPDLGVDSDENISDMCSTIFSFYYGRFINKSDKIGESHIQKYVNDTVTKLMRDRPDIAIVNSKLTKIGEIFKEICID